MAEEEEIKMRIEREAIFSSLVSPWSHSQI
jgi:hypothetical protein